MADTKVSALTALTGSNLANGDLFYVVDVSAGTAGSKSITFSEMKTVLQPYSANLATLASGVSGGTLSLTVGGTGLSSCTTGDLLIGTAANALGRLAAGSSNNVLAISGGSPAWTNALSIATLSASGQITSTVTTGTAPFVVASTTEVANLNAARLQGSAASAFATASHTHAASEVSAGTFTGNYLFTGSTSDPPVRIRPHASAATIADFENSSGTIKAYVDTSGNIVSSSSLRSQVATGQAPIVVDSSTTACTNLNADMVDGYNASDFVLKSSTNYTAGVLLQGTGAGNLLAPLALGTSGQVLTATSGTGLTWTTPSAGGGSGATSATVEFSAPSLFSVGTNGASLLNLGDATTARMCRGFDDTTECYAYGSVCVPSNINGSGTVSFTAIGGLRSSTTGNLLWTFGEREAADTESWTGAYAEYDSASTAISGATTTQRAITWSVAVSTLGWASGDIVRFRVSRDPGVSGDATGDALLDSFSIKFPLS